MIFSLDLRIWLCAILPSSPERKRDITGENNQRSNNMTIEKAIEKLTAAHANAEAEGRTEDAKWLLAALEVLSGLE